MVSLNSNDSRDYYILSSQILKFQKTATFTAAVFSVNNYRLI